MKNLFAVVMSTALLAGLAGSAFAYRSASAEPTSAPSAVHETHPAHAARTTPRETARPVVHRWAPCRAPSQLEQGVCVRTVVRTVVVPAAPSAVAAVRTAPRPPAASPTHAGPSAAHEVGDDHGPSQVHPTESGDDRGGDDRGGDDGGGDDGGGDDGGGDHGDGGEDDD